MKNKIVIALLLFQSVLFAQPKIVTPLKIGSKMPDMHLGKAINYKGTEINYADLKGKLVILDFWATWCSPCIKTLQTLDSLQKEYGDKIAVIPVTNEAFTGRDDEIVKKFIQQNPWFQLPSIVEDVKLSALFPHRMIPHDIWIAPDGIIKAITGGEEVTRENIDKILSDPGYQLTEKVDNMDFDAGKPFLVNGNGGTADNFIYRVIFTNEIPGIASLRRKHVNSENNITNFLSTNCGELVLFYPAVSMGRTGRSFDTNYIYIESGDSCHHITAAELDKMLKNQKLYCYNATLPGNISDSLFFRKYYLDDLNKCLKWKARVERKKVPSYAVIRIKKNTDELLLAKATDSSGWNFSDKHEVLLNMRNTPFSEVIDLLRWFHSPLPIVNNTGYNSERVDIDLNLNWERDGAYKKALDYEAVRKILNRYGLDIIEVPDGLAEVLVLSNVD